MYQPKKARIHERDRGNNQDACSRNQRPIGLAQSVTLETQVEMLLEYN